MKDTLNKLLTEYYKLFPNDGLFPEWVDTSDEEKINMLTESIKEKRALKKPKYL